MFENWQKLVSTEKLCVLFLRISPIQASLILHYYRGDTDAQVYNNLKFL